MFIELALVSILNSVNLAFLIEQTRAAKLYNRGGVELRETTTPRGSIVFSDCSSGFWLGECSDPPRLRYANTGVFGGRVADLLRMTQTALTSQKTSGRTDQGKFTTYFTRGLAGDSRLTLDYCAELVTNAFRLTPSARRRDAPEDSLLADGSKACLVHFNGPSKHFWRTRLT